jgi:TetR/AcrR family transcriptional regulator, regulator of cefoperazone and chloramphenicol sensitivity
VFNTWNVRLGDEDRKTSAVIRDHAMELFAAHGTSSVTVRQIASAAGVSPGLVIHHFGSKDGLKEAVDRRAAKFVQDLLADMDRTGSEGGSSSLAELFADRLAAEPALVGYVRRLLCEGGEAGDALFARLLDATVSGMRTLAEAGVVRQGGDETLRAAFLLANDLAMVLLRSQIEAATGTDPLDRAGLVRWSAEVRDIYTNGIFASTHSTPEPEPARRRPPAGR